MAQFRGTVEGNRGQASRLGHKTSGLTTICNAWNIGVKCYADHRDGKDMIQIVITGGSNGARSSEYLAWIDSSGNVCVNHEVDNVTSKKERLQAIEEQGAA